MPSNGARLAVAALLAVALLFGGAWLWRQEKQPPEIAPALEVPRHELTLYDGRLCPKAGGEPFTGIMFESDKSGQRLTEVPVRNGIVHGLAHGWHQNGQLEVEEFFENGVSHGVRKRWYPNGQARNSATIVQGVFEGPFTEWHENGQVATRMNLVAGKGEGLCESWNSDGTVKGQVTLKNGVPVEPELLVKEMNP